MNIAYSNPKHVRRDTSPDQKINHNSVSLSPALQLTNFNDDMLYQLCHYLPLHETNVLARSCKRLDQVIDKGFYRLRVKAGLSDSGQYNRMAKDRTPINLSTSKWMSFFRHKVASGIDGKYPIYLRQDDKSQIPAYRVNGAL